MRSFKIKMITFARLYKPLLEFFLPKLGNFTIWQKILKLSGSHVNQRFQLFFQHWYKINPLAKTWAFIRDEPSSKMRNHLKLNHLENASWRWWKLENASWRWWKLENISYCYCFSWIFHFMFSLFLVNYPCVNKRGTLLCLLLTL